MFVSNVSSLEGRINEMKKMKNENKKQTTAPLTACHLIFVIATWAVLDIVAKLLHTDAFSDVARHLISTNLVAFVCRNEEIRRAFRPYGVLAVLLLVASAFTWCNIICLKCRSDGT